MSTISINKKIRRNIRFGLFLTNSGTAPYCGCKFKLTQNNNDFYIFLRKTNLKTKISLHESGITRYAEVTQSNRLPIKKETIGLLRQNKWTTVFRSIYIPIGDYGCSIEKIEDFVGISPHHFIGRSIVSFQVGFMKGNNERSIPPASGPNTHLRVLDFTYKNEPAILALTASAYNRNEIIQLLSQTHISSNSYLSIERRAFMDDRGRGFSEAIINYHSALNTYTYLIFYGIPPSETNHWWKENTLFKAIDQTGHFSTILEKISAKEISWEALDNSL